MTIYGMDDEKTLKSTDPSCQIFIWKGDPKPSNSPGKDLGELFRVQIGDALLRDRFARIYQRRGDFLEAKTLSVEGKNGKKKQEEFLYVKKLNVYLAYNDWQKAFFTVEKNQKGRNTIWNCNRQVIYEEYLEEKDWVGNVRRYPAPCDKPCQAPPENVHVDCPAGCQKNGFLYFYLWEFADYNKFPLCRINTHAYCDFYALPRELKNIFALYGGVRTSPLEVPGFGREIAYTLTRRETPINRPITQPDYSTGKKRNLRTGKKAEGTHWGLSLSIMPEWSQQFKAIQTVNQVRALGGVPSSLALKAAYSDAVVEAEIISEPPAIATQQKPVNLAEVVATLATEDVWIPAEADLDGLKELLKQYNWTKEQFNSLLAKHDLEWSQIRTMNLSQWECITQAIQSSEAKQICS